MSADPYNAIVRQYFTQTEHRGNVDDGAVGYFEDQGIRIRLSADVADGVITCLKFRALGCPHVIAATEAVCRRFEGRPVADLEQFDSGHILRDLAVPVEKSGRILVLEDTVRSLRAAISDRMATTQD